LIVPIVKKSALVGHSASQMFRLVADVESYPKFLPWCHSAKLLSRGENELCGQIEVARMGIRQTFSTRNRFVLDEWMDLELLDGPFRKLSGRWTFIALRADACKVELELDFEFSGKVIDKAFGAVFHQIANTLVDAFCQRADEVYK
jgi:ribosome-associated toxin RatA of RatAB toxin-antitoxin module